MKKLYIMGIDPGKSGGYALGICKIEQNQEAPVDGIVEYGPMPLVGGDIDISPLVDTIETYVVQKQNLLIVIEKVGAMPGQGVSSLFTFARGYGQLIGMCQALRISYHLVAPQTWKSQVLKDTKKDKDAAVSFVTRTFPKTGLVLPGCRKSHDGIADAICLMQWGILNHG